MYRPNLQRTNQDIIQEIENNIVYPLLTKPVNGAASENITLINNKKQLSDFIAINRVFIDSGYYFFEQFIKGRELSTGRISAINKLLNVIEIKLIGEKYQSNRVKFSSGFKENIVPAKIPPKIYNEAQSIARDLHSAFYCRTFSRTDMIYDEENQKLYPIEINTNPGLLENSLLLLLVKTSGMSIREFFLKLIHHSITEKN
jgi:D-alanine-D-alanine ligase